MSMGFQMYEKQNTFLFRLDPRVKIIGLLIAFSYSVIFSDPYFLGTMFFAILILILSSKVPFRKIKPLIFALMTLAIISFLMWPLFFKDGNLLVSIWIIKITDKGIKFGIAMAFRILCMTIASITLMLVTSQRDLILGLRGLRLQYNQSFVFATALRFLPMMAGIGKTINEAQRARALNLDKGLMVKLKNNAAILAPMIIESIRLSQQLMLSIEARGFDRRDVKTTIRKLEYGTQDIITLIIFGIIISCSVFLRILGYGHMAR